MESIYHLIEAKEAKPVKNAMYHSTHAPNLPPTASTFGATETTQVGVTNCNGDNDFNPVRAHVRESATFGPPRNGGRKPKPDMFLKSKASSKALPQPSAFKYDDAETAKPPLPKQSEAPISGQKTNKNFIVCNAIENILASSNTQNKVTQEAEAKHAEFGKVPKYLSSVKAQIEAEYAHIAQIKAQKEEANRLKIGHIELLPEDERVDLLNAMKAKWDKINHEYQTMTHLVYLDTISKVKRKEHFEASLKRLEKDIERLSKKNVFVRHD